MQSLHGLNRSKILQKELSNALVVFGTVSKVLNLNIASSVSAMAMYVNYALGSNLVHSCLWSENLAMSIV